MRALHDISCRLLFAALAGGSTMVAAANSTADRVGACAALASIRLPGARVLSAELIEAGRFKTSDGKLFPNQNAFCRVLGRATPSSDSDIRFEVWLPEEGWNGRLWGVGNGDFAGSVCTRALASRIAESYAAVGTDTGHQPSASSRRSTVAPRGMPISEPVPMVAGKP